MPVRAELIGVAKDTLGITAYQQEVEADKSDGYSRGDQLEMGITMGIAQFAEPLISKDIVGLLHGQEQKIFYESHRSVAVILDYSSLFGALFLSYLAFNADRQDSLPLVGATVGSKLVYNAVVSAAPRISSAIRSRRNNSTA